MIALAIEYMMDQDDLRASILLTAFDRVVSPVSPESDWLSQNSLEIDHLSTSARSIQWTIAIETAIERNHLECFSILASHYHGSDWETRTELLVQLLSVAITHASNLIVASLLETMSDLTALQTEIDAIQTIQMPTKMAQECLQILMDRPSAEMPIRSILAALQYGADPTPHHEQFLKLAVTDYRIAEYLVSHNVRVIPERAHAMFWAEMTRRQCPSYQVLHAIWDRYQDHIQPNGIFAEVDQITNTYTGKSGSRWQLALQIDPEACCYIEWSNRAAKIMIKLANIGQRELDAFLSRFPATSCPQSPSSGHRLDVFAKSNDAMWSVVFGNNLIYHDRTMPIVQALIDASCKNAIDGDYRSYHLHDQMILIADSPVESRMPHQDPVLLQPVRYHNLDVVGLNLSSGKLPTPASVMTACQTSASINQLAWRKQQDQHARELEAFRTRC